MATRFLASLQHICLLDSLAAAAQNRSTTTRLIFSCTHQSARNMATANSTQRGDTTCDEADLKRGPGLLKVLEGNPKRLKRIKFLSELFRARGFELRIAGGAVRDMLRGKEPKDIDFATTARPEQTLDIVTKHEDLLRIIVTAAGQKHGTIAVKFKEAEIDFKRVKLSHEPGASVLQQAASNKEPEYDDESPYEITTLRCDKVTDGRHAEVEFISDWKVDAERRDLTINAMFLTLDDGQLVDFFGGESDLKQGVVRFVGDAERRIQEDYLRILRYFRFWSRYSMGKQPDDTTLKTLSANLGGLQQISGERIWQEIKKTLSHLPCYDAFELMLRLKLFDYAGLLDPNLQDYEQYKSKVLEEVKTSQDNLKKYLNEVLEPKLAADPQDAAARRLKDLVPVIIFAAAIQDDNLCASAYKRVRFSNKERDTILYMIANRDKKPALGAFKFQLVMSPVGERPDVLLRMKAYLISRGLPGMIDELEAWPVPQFPLNGREVAAAVRERKLPGERTKQALDAVKLDWAKDDFKTDEATLREWTKTKLDAMVAAKHSNQTSEPETNVI